MLLITSLFFLYCNRFWWWILWPPGFFSAIPFLGFVFDFFQVCHPKTRCSPHTEISLCIFVFSQLLFDIPHLFVALAWYKRSKRTAAKHSQRQWATEGQETHEWSCECRWPWDPNPELYKLYKIKIKRNYKWNTRQDDQSHSIYIQYLIMHNFSAAGLPQRRQGRRWLQATAPTAASTRLRLWMCLCECTLLILIALRMGAQGLTKGA